MLLMTAVIVGVVMWMIEGWTNDADFPDASRGISEGIFKSTQIFVGGGDIRFGATTYLGKLIVWFFSFAVLVLMALYTAQVTTQLVTQVTTARKEITSFTQAIETGHTVCALEAAAEGLSERYPKIVLIGQQNSLDVLMLMDAGNCSVAILTKNEWERATMGGSQMSTHRDFSHIPSA